MSHIHIHLHDAPRKSKDSSGAAKDSIGPFEYAIKNASGQYYNGSGFGGSKMDIWTATEAACYRKIDSGDPKFKKCTVEHLI